ncbi:alpha/beta fold hydrolase [Jeotgalibacillus campisalis]|uniref:Alpha/beta hydrolase n=1 Tax=Jeotgalibacillus campisalis TaxID=220754 RepID=A0A0C2RN36_9BACL|nr:alpha/beta hydrolase [Jeotgalibacillus campisalis]KIL43184.1 alpha/beta hydrolase [Jeotgalibacillus campisalis]
MWEKRQIETARGEFEVFTAGSGEPLCVTHLYSEFDERGYYFADPFVDFFTVYLVNLKEAGNSSRVVHEEELSMRETAMDLEAIRMSLGFDTWNFAGHSTGGMLGLVYAVDHPHSLKRLMVGGASSSNDYMNYKDSIYSQKNPKNKRLKDIFSILNSPHAATDERRLAGREWTEMSLHEPSRFEEYFSKPSSGKVVPKRLDYYSYKELPTYDIRDDITQIKTPTLVYCGTYDAQCPIHFSEEIRKLVLGSAFYEFEASNHLPYLEEKDKFIEMIKDFIGLGSR